MCLYTLNYNKYYSGIFCSTLQASVERQFTSLLNWRLASLYFVTVWLALLNVLNFGVRLQSKKPCSLYPISAYTLTQIKRAIDMNTNFKVVPLKSIAFLSYFNMTESELKKHDAYIFEADECPCYPCRVSLQDAEIGERVLALAYEHHSAVNSPYRSSGPIFVREGAVMARAQINEVPKMLLHRMLSVRGYNIQGNMIEADTVRGAEITSVLNSQLSNKDVSYIHIHNSGPGCFNCAVERA